MGKLRAASLPARSLALHAFLVTLAAGLGAVAVWLELGPWTAFWSILLLGLAAGALAAPLFWSSSRRLLAALRDGVQGLRQGDASLRLVADRDDELGDMVELYNELADTVGRERSALRQRELLLHAALETSPAAVLLVSSGERIILGNRVARQIFFKGRRLEGRSLEEIADACPPALGRAITEATDSLLTAEIDGQEETFHVTRRIFELNARRHVLVMVRHMTAELRRQEAAIWRKVLRVIGHEIHNSLAPIRSLARSGRHLRTTDPADPRLDEILASIEESADGLHRFVDGYRRYARLPEPRLETVDLRSFLLHLQGSEPFRLEGDLPSRTVDVDPGQLRQVLQNLLKNAREAGSPEDQIVLRVDDLPAGGVALRVQDRGEGMDEETLTQASLPFFSSKAEGTGLGLALSREILEAHGGSLDLALRPGGGVTVTCRLPALRPG